MGDVVNKMKEDPSLRLALAVFSLHYLSFGRREPVVFPRLRLAVYNFLRFPRIDCFRSARCFNTMSGCLIVFS